MDVEELRTRLENSVLGLEEMINGVMMQAMANNVDPYQMQRSDGYPVLAPLIALQASCLMTLANMPGGEA
jgi:hypothetical protein